MGRPYELVPGVTVIPSVATGTLDWPDVAPWIAELKTVLAQPGRYMLLVDARDAINTTQACRVNLIRETREGQFETCGAAVFGTSMIFRLSVAALALVDTKAPVRAFADEETARTWLTRVARTLAEPAAHSAP